MEEKRLIPFSNGCEADSWLCRNCFRCKKYENESQIIENAGCKLAFSVEYAYADDGKINLSIAEEIGYSNISDTHVALNSRCSLLRVNRNRKNNDMHCIIYRLRKKGVKGINVKERVIYYDYNNTEQIENMKLKPVERLCKEFGFGRQSVFV